jgi:hypothetical protein
MTQAKLLENLKSYCGDKFSFSTAKNYFWSPKDLTVYYQEDDLSEVGLWTLLHEVCHGLLQHKTYESDFELVLLEVGAWERAEKLVTDFGLKIDQDHVQDCLDSYRDWQYKRSLCPRCDLGGIQIDQKTYKCLFCGDTWNVSAARFCRPYRRKALK